MTGLGVTVHGVSTVWTRPQAGVMPRRRCGLHARGAISDIRVSSFLTINRNSRAKHMRTTRFYLPHRLLRGKTLTIHIRNNYQTSNSDIYATMRHHMRFLRSRAPPRQIISDHLASARGPRQDLTRMRSRVGSKDLEE